MYIHRDRQTWKTRCRRLLASVLAILCLTPAVYAAGTATITFTGKTGQFIFESDSRDPELQFFQGLQTAEPGQMLTQQLLFTNTSSLSDSVALYVRAIPEGIKVPLSPIRGENPMPEELHTFLSQMRMRIWNDSRIVYDAGPDENRDMTRPLYLGTFAKNEIDTLIAELTIPETAGDVQKKYPISWVFSVEPFNATQRTVTKLWKDGAYAHSGERVTVRLLKDGELAEEAELNEQNNWTCTFENLLSTNPQEQPVWTVEEVGAEDSVRYVTEGNITMIYPNEALPSVMYPQDGIELQDPQVPMSSGSPEKLTVRTVWAQEEATLPLQTTVVLYNGDYPMDAVILDSRNDWTHTWEDLEPGGNWRVMERYTPLGYAPAYEVSGDTVTITNTSSTFYPKHVNCSAAIIIGLGLPMVALGIFALVKKKPYKYE